MITRLNALLGACCLAVSSLNAAETAAPDDWDVSAPPGQAREVGIDVSSGTWMSLDVSPDGETIAFDLLVEFADLPMMRKCMLGIKRRAEQTQARNFGSSGGP